MKVLAVVALLFVAAQALPTGDDLRIDHSAVSPVYRQMPVIEGAPEASEARIVNGNTATRGQFPFQVALYLDGMSFCGGSLISTRWVLTAAHCASGITSFVAHLGAQSLSASVADEDGRQLISTTTKIVHSGYSASTLSNDVALLNLGTDITLNSYIQTIKFVSGANTYAGTVARVSGWGRTSDYSGVSETLQYADLSIISNSECADYYGSIVISSTICASTTNGQSTCNGDSGGPLVDPYTGNQIGVVSFGSIYGCSFLLPVGFGRLTSFSSWITSNTGIASA